MRALLLIFLAIALTTCTKFGRTITVKGRVLNPITGEGVEGIKIQLVRSQSFKLPGGYKEVKSTTSDANGNFEINKSGFNHYSIQAQFVDYPIGWFVDGEFKGDFRMPVKVGKKITADYHTVPYGKYAISIQNINCSGVNDTIIINQSNQVGSFIDVDWVLTGCQNYTTAFSNVPMGNITINWTVIRSGISNSYSETIFLQGGQELLYVLEY